MLKVNPDKYFILWFRYHQQNGYMLWVENPESERLWTDERQRVIAFKNQDGILALAQDLGMCLEAAQPRLLDVDEVAAWIANTQKRPPGDSLNAWNTFDDLSRSIGKVFSGNVKAPVRNRVFELLYATFGPWRSSSVVVWPRQERNVLRRILRQGLRLWDKHVYWAE